VPIEGDEPGVGKLLRGAQLAGAQRGRRASDAAEVAFASSRDPRAEP
jgi:hypothetical protein